MTKLEQIAGGQTDAVFEFISGGGAPTATDRESVSLVQWCAYYGDVSALKFLLSKRGHPRIVGRQYRIDRRLFPRSLAAM
jgi:hypothetical protein